MLGNTNSVSRAEEAAEVQVELANRYIRAGTLIGTGTTVFDVIVRADRTAHSTCAGSARGATGRDTVTTDILPAPEFYHAENYHQQYLAKNPGGYYCLGRTGVTFE